MDIETYGLGVDARRIQVVTIAHTGEAVFFDPRDPYQRTWWRTRSRTYRTSSTCAFDVLNGAERAQDCSGHRQGRRHHDLCPVGRTGPAHQEGPDGPSLSYLARPPARRAKPGNQGSANSIQNQ